ncbi:3-methyl-2-oxobutanoate dehydrogenase subunit VorB [Candidatus Omnitrophota bacterium]
MKRKPSTENRTPQLMTGNEAIGEAAVQAGCQFYAGYPITPQNELTAYMFRRMAEEGRPSVQSESELAAINMVFGASVTGARCMTSSSSPGISLKQEGISYLAACRLPSVIVNIMRGGPGLGNIAPGQADYFQATKGGGHGDYHMIVLAPSTVQEAFDLTKLSFDLADEYRTPVMVLADGVLGQMMEPISLGTNTARLSARQVNRPPDGEAGKPTTDKEWALTGARGRDPRSIKSLLLKAGKLEELNLILQDTYTAIRNAEVRFEKFMCDDADLIIVAYGIVSRIARACVKELRSQGKKIGLLRPITLWPFPKGELNELSKKTKKFLSLELSAGQMVEDVQLSVGKDSNVYFYGRMGGTVCEKEEVEKEILRYI